MATRVHDPGDDIAAQGYRLTIADLEARRETPTIEAAQAGAFQAVMAALADGRLRRDNVEVRYAHEKARKAHESVTEHGKSLVAQLAQGQLALADLLDDVVLPVGDGRTVATFGSLDAAMLATVRTARYDKMREAADAYDEFEKGIFRPIFPVLLQSGLIIRDAYAQGLL